MRFIKRIRVPASTKQAIDFEKLGYDTMTDVGDRNAAEEICALHLHAYKDQFHPTIVDLDSGISHRQSGLEALCCHLYERADPVRDSLMFARTIAINILYLLTTADALGSVAAHIAALYLIGWTVGAVIAGPIFTIFAAAAGYLAFERLLSTSKAFQSIVITAAALLAFWGLTQWAQARAMVVTRAEEPTSSAASYVDGSAEPLAERPPDKSEEQATRQTLRGAWIKILLSADLMLGILLGNLMKIRTDEDYTAWRKLKSLKEEIGQMELEMNNLTSLFEIAKKKCMAGILRAEHKPKRSHKPYFRTMSIILLMAMLIPAPARSQNMTRQEGILIDISGSIGSGGANNDLFRDYLQGARQLLESEPPSSRVVVTVITTDSFGSVRELLKGWTPEAHGVFTDELNHARRQLGSTFAAKTSTMTPIAAGTDIIGGLWHMKAILESGSPKDAPAQREIWIFSDMMNETPALSMPALLAAGPVKMIEQAKANGLVVPLKDYRIHLLGASTRGLTPKAWNTIKAFWSGYFESAGAELVTYSTATVGR